MLTDRQQQVIELSNTGYSISEIAHKIGLSYHTVREHLLKARKKIEQEGLEDSYASTQESPESEFSKQQVAYWKKLYTNLKTTSELEEEILRIFKETFNAYEPVKYIIPRDKSSRAGTHEELVLLLSDFHAGEEVNPGEMLNTNEYNMDIMIERVKKLHRSVMAILDKMSGYTYYKVNIFALGDMVSGIIHEELLQGTCTVDQVVVTAELMADLVYEFAKKFKEVEFIGVVGNHGRFNKAPNFKKKYNNFDYLLYKMIESKCVNLKNVTFNIPKAGMAAKKIFNWNFLLMHGDGIRSFGGIPFYGIRRADSQLTQLLVTKNDFYPHYVCMGHFHNTNIIEKIGGKIIMNGTLKGGDEYALGKMFTGGDPKQLLMSVHPKHGITWQMDINL